MNRGVFSVPQYDTRKTRKCALRLNRNADTMKDDLAPLAQRIERRPPEAKAQVRFLWGAYFF